MPPFTYRKRKAGGGYFAGLSTYNPRAPKRARVTYARPAARVYPGYTRSAGNYGRYRGLGAELKFHDVDLDDAVVASAGGITDSINKIAQDTTEKTRVGRKCTIKKIGWRYNYTLPEQDAVADPAAGDVLRMILYHDTQANGATAGIGGSTGGTLLVAADYQAFNNLTNSGRFKVLMDRTVSINYQTTASDGAGVVSQSSVIRSGSFYKSCNIPLEFDAAAGAITEIRSNNLGVLLIRKNGICGFASKFRLRFTDF